MCTLKEARRQRSALGLPGWDMGCGIWVAEIGPDRPLHGARWLELSPFRVQSFCTALRYPSDGVLHK